MFRLAALSALLLCMLCFIALRLAFSVVFALSGVRRHEQVLNW
jgi:hypothetical protein